MTQSPLFAAFLTPHRALDLVAIKKVIAFFAALAAIPGLIFFAMGAWPIVGFLGLDVLVLYWALTASLKSADAFEEITLWRDELDVRSVSEKGAETLVRFNPFFVRFAAIRDRENRVTALKLSTRERDIEIGRFLTPEDKASFATDFSAALHKAKA